MRRSSIEKGTRRGFSPCRRRSAAGHRSRSPHNASRGPLGPGSRYLAVCRPGHELSTTRKPFTASRTIDVLWVTCDPCWRSEGHDGTNRIGWECLNQALLWPRRAKVNTLRQVAAFMHPTADRVERSNAGVAGHGPHPPVPHGVDVVLKVFCRDVTGFGETAGRRLLERGPHELHTTRWSWAARF